MMQVSKKKQVAKKKSAAIVGSRRISIDIVTGMEVVSVYFDPEESIDFDSTDEASVGKHLYESAAIVKDDGTIMSVKLHNGDVFKIHSSSAVKVTEQDDQGVDDILALRDFSEKSLTHTLRSRYTRDDIYTFVGPILISINPYKWFKDLYTEKTMTDYQGKKQVSRIIYFLFDSFLHNPMLTFSLLHLGRSATTFVCPRGHCLYLFDAKHHQCEVQGSVYHHIR